ncbi:methyltransf_25 domain-containing protein [Trichonephila inaurata madagascariensis]|uniref:Methyltransf_25 domain-containing protein n=1 Tax=Trichonephila inaurata madagascariensis TaxID=2747483 RepID=A0A8X6YFR0_9ARAC|nr:methyltransf_25 domain-containing protein [Trichonephila inaurata madagascariensis]
MERTNFSPNINELLSLVQRSGKQFSSRLRCTAAWRTSGLLFRSGEVDLCIPESYYKKYDSLHYQKLVEDIGFKVVLCRSEFKINRLPSHEEAKDLFYSICSVLPHIPAEHRQVFKDDFYQSLLDNGARNDDGAPLHRALTLEIVVQKPDFASD